jgi:hypothetical protein
MRKATLLAAIAAICLAWTRPSVAESEERAPVKVAKDTAIGYIKSFFYNLQTNRFSHAYFLLDADPTISSSDFRNVFEDSPISQKNLKILGAKPDKQDWIVDFSIQVTSYESALAGCLLNTKYAMDNDEDPPVYRFAPRKFDIETFMTIRQSWRVSATDTPHGLPKIKLEFSPGGYLGSDKNILNYFLDAVDMRNHFMNMKPTPVKDVEPLIYASTGWATRVAFDLGLDKSSEKTMANKRSKAIDLYGKAADMLQKMVDAANKKAAGQKP